MWCVRDQDDSNPKNCFWKVNAKENPQTVTVTTSQKTDVKKMEEEEMTKMKNTKGKQVNWLHILASKVKIVKL